MISKYPQFMMKDDTLVLIQWKGGQYNFMIET